MTPRQKTIVDMMRISAMRIQEAAKSLLRDEKENELLFFIQNAEEEMKSLEDNKKLLMKELCKDHPDATLGNCETCGKPRLSCADVCDHFSKEFMR